MFAAHSFFTPIAASAIAAVAAVRAITIKTITG